MKLKNSLLKNFSFGFCQSLLNRLGAFIFVIFLARFLMPEKFGEYTLILSVIMIFHTLSDLGINKTVLTYISKSLNNQKQIPSLHKYLLKIQITLAFGCSLFLLLISYPLSIYVFKNPNLLFPFLLASLYSFVLSIEGFYTHILYAVEKINYLCLKEFLFQTIRILLLLIIFFVVSTSSKVLGVFIVLTISVAFTLFYCLYYCKKFIPNLYKKSTRKINKQKINKFVFSLGVASIAVAFFSRLDTIILGIFLDSIYIGFYSAAFSIYAGISGLFSFLGPILLSSFSKSNKNSKKGTFKKVFRYLSYLIIPSVFGLIIFSDVIIKIFYGDNYLNSIVPFCFLIPLIFLAVSIAIILPLFVADNKPNILAKLVIFVSIINVILNIVLIKIFIRISEVWAMNGVAIATLVSWIIYFILAVYYLKKEINLSIPYKDILKTIISSILMTLIIIFALGNLHIVFSILIGIVVYLLFMILFKAIRKEDLAFFLRLLQRVRKPKGF